MDFIITAIVFLVIFSILVLVHELGHFYAAKKSGIKVEEFGFGLPPRIWGVKRGETIYSVNWIPFGGFVKLLGEDASDTKSINDKRSFVSKPARLRIFVVIAGVLMNLLLAFLLLTFGFTFGIQPLILNGEAVLENIDNGTIKIDNAVVIKNVLKGSIAEQAGFLTGDYIVSIDNKDIASLSDLEKIKQFGDVNSFDVTIRRNGNLKQIFMQGDKGQSSGLEMYDTLFLPRVIIKDVEKDSEMEKAGIKPNDVILRINDKAIYFVHDTNTKPDSYIEKMYDYYEAIEGKTELKFTVLRNNDIQNYMVNMPDRSLVIVSDVMPDTPAYNAGLQKGDLIIAVNAQPVRSPENVVEFAKNVNEANLYEIKRGDKVITYSIIPDKKGLIGVGLSEVVSQKNFQLSIYASDMPVSIKKIDDVVYPFWVAPVKAVEEMGKLSVMTAQMFVDVIRTIVTKFIVPEGVAGPVGIAQLTSVFVKEGILSILRFMALLSLSLAIINILPFPALDGGRLFFILIEIIVGRRINPKIEAVIHTVGFLLLLLLILIVTYNDILRLIF